MTGVQTCALPIYHALVVTACFQGNAFDAGLVQASSQVDQAATIAADGEAKIARQDMNVELVLADVDAGDRYTVVHLRDPFLAYGLVTMQPCGLCEETMRAPSFATVSVETASVDLNGLRAVDAGGVASSSRVSTLSGAFITTCKDLMPVATYDEILRFAQDDMKPLKSGAA